MFRYSISTSVSPVDDDQITFGWHNKNIWITIGGFSLQHLAIKGNSD
jgi:hypothetical protein